jgi:hypothetical protein
MQIKTVVFWIRTLYGFVGVTDIMEMEVAKTFAQLVCYVHCGGAISPDEG